MKLTLRTLVPILAYKDYTNLPIQAEDLFAKLAIPLVSHALHQIQLAIAIYVMPLMLIQQVIIIKILLKQHALCTALYILIDIKADIRLFVQHVQETVNDA